MAYRLILCYRLETRLILIFKERASVEGAELVSVARRLRERHVGKRFLLETSGGITEGNLQERAINGMPYIPRASLDLKLIV